MNIYDVLKEEAVLLNSLVVILWFITIVIFIISFLCRNKEHLLLKVGGVLSVSILAMLANNTVVYGLTILIIATFITKLDFLENIAALFTGQEAYWKHKTDVHLSKANEKELGLKKDQEYREYIAMQADLKQEEERSKNEKLEREKEKYKHNIRNEAMNFESDSIRALKENNVFEEIHNEMRLSINEKSFIFDAIGILSLNHFIIETKFYENLNAVKRTIPQMMGFLSMYEKYLSRDRNFRYNVKNNVKGIIIVPSGNPIDNFLTERIAVLKYDQKSKQFTNLKQIKNWLNY